ncbi:hypothetical protein [Desulfonatronospira sp.]|uniref:hypothetical protein n=1 Tax=Desulfonatronospira sp. TaxID=1962951 RepID=UPI0025BB35A4|nr:hypothetical protein [Desulfonatronospira sp.]
MKKVIVILSLVSLVCFLTSSQLQAEKIRPLSSFAADMLSIFHDGSEEMRGKVYASPEGTRMEMDILEHSAELSGVIMIENFTKNMILMCGQEGMEKTCLQFPVVIDQHDMDNYSFMEFGNPCPWDNDDYWDDPIWDNDYRDDESYYADQGEVKATRLGTDNLHGRKVEKWRCEHPNGDVSTSWYDTKLQTVIRAEGSDGKFELTNIKEGRISKDFFEVPEGYELVSFEDHFKGLYNFQE